MNITQIYSQIGLLNEKIDHLFETNYNLQLNNKKLQDKIEALNQELQSKKKAEGRQVKQKELVQAKIDSLLAKLNNFSELS